MIVWKQLCHPNIAPLLGIWEWDLTGEQSDTPMQCLVSPWAPHGNLVEYLRVHEPGKHKPDLPSVLQKIADALSYLHVHEPPMVHADLHPANILIDHAYEPRLTDFGLSTFAGSFTTTGTQTIHGNDHYLAPEFIMGQGGIWTPMPESDMYAFACLGLQMYTGKMPWGNVPSYKFKDMVTQGQRPNRPSQETPIPDYVWEVIQACWAQEPSERMKSTHAWTSLMEYCRGQR